MIASRTKNEFLDNQLSNMEGFAALGIVANICQFVEYAFKISEAARELHRSGFLDNDLKSTRCASKL